MATWGDIGQMALEEVGAVNVGGQPERLEELSALRKLKVLIDTFVLDGFIVPGYERRTLTVAGPVKTTYTLGPAHDIEAATVPVRIKDISYKPVGFLDFRPIDEISIDTYQNERRSNLTGSYPWAFYYELGAVFGTIYFTSSPTVGDQFEIVWPRFLLPDGDLVSSEEAVVPLGWARYLYLALAAELTNSYRLDLKTARDIKYKAAAAKTDIVGNLHTAGRRTVDPMFQIQRRSMRRGSSWR